MAKFPEYFCFRVQPNYKSMEIELEEIDPADIVTWSWLQSYADGKRCNYVSDFIIEAKKEYKQRES